MIKSEIKSTSRALFSIRLGGFERCFLKYRRCILRRKRRVHTHFTFQQLDWATHHTDTHKHRGRVTTTTDCSHTAYHYIPVISKYTLGYTISFVTLLLLFILLLLLLLLLFVLLMLFLFGLDGLIGICPNVCTLVTGGN